MLLVESTWFVRISEIINKPTYFTWCNNIIISDSGADYLHSRTGAKSDCHRRWMVCWHIDTAVSWQWWHNDKWHSDLCCVTYICLEWQVTAETESRQCKGNVHVENSLYSGVLL